MCMTKSVIISIMASFPWSRGILLWPKKNPWVAIIVLLRHYFGQKTKNNGPQKKK